MGVTLWFFQRGRSAAFNIIISHIFPENFIEVLQVVQKICRFFSPILTALINFLDFLTFPCFKETTDVVILKEGEGEGVEGKIDSLPEQKELVFPYKGYARQVL